LTAKTYGADLLMRANYEKETFKKLLLLLSCAA